MNRKPGSGPQEAQTNESPKVAPDDAAQRKALEDRVYEVFGWLDQQEAALKSGKAEANSGRTITAEEIKFIRDHWRPLEPDKKTAEFRRIFLNQAEALLLEAHLCKALPKIKSYGMRDPNLHKQADYEGVILLKGYRQAGKCIVLEKDASPDDLSATITKIKMSREMATDITEGEKRTFPFSGVDNAFLQQFSATYVTEMTDSRAWYFGDVVHDDENKSFQDKKNELFPQLIQSHYDQFKKGPFNFVSIDKDMQTFVDGLVEENKKLKQNFVARAYAEATGQSQLTNADEVEVSRIAEAWDANELPAQALHDLLADRIRDRRELTDFIEQQFEEFSLSPEQREGYRKVLLSEYLLNKDRKLEPYKDFVRDEIMGKALMSRYPGDDWRRKYKKAIVSEYVHQREGNGNFDEFIEKVATKMKDFQETPFATLKNARMQEAIKMNGNKPLTKEQADEIENGSKILIIRYTQQDKPLKDFIKDQIKEAKQFSEAVLQKQKSKKADPNEGQEMMEMQELRPKPGSKRQGR